MNTRRGPASNAGFSLVELMIAIVAGIVVTGAAVAFTISSLKANGEYVASTRLIQDLRNALDFVSDDLRRAGYDQAAMTYVANPSSGAASAFAPIKVVTTSGANCIVYAYDRPSGTRGSIDLANGEVRAVRRQSPSINGTTTGVLEVADSSIASTPVRPDCDAAGPDYSQYPVTCNTTTGWCPLTDGRVLNVSDFTVSATASGTNTHGIQTIAAGSGFNAMSLREYQLTLTGNLKKDTTVTRTVRSNVKVRADCIRQDLANCVVSP